MSFDKRWIEFEKQHGPQSPGAKEDALFWYNAGAADTAPIINDLHHEIEELKAELSEANSGPTES